MLDLNAFASDPDPLMRALRRRGDLPGLDQLLALHKQRKELLTSLQTLQAERNRQNDAMKKATPDEREQARTALRELGDRIKAGEAEQRTVEEQLEALALTVPNPPHESVPDGAGADDNVVTKTVLSPPQLGFPAKDHVDLATGLGILDTERAGKVSGSRFSFLRGQGARLERALANFMLDFHLERGDVELSPPLLVNAASLQGTGQLPKFADDLFAVSFGPPAEPGPTPLYLIPTSEVPVTNYHAGEILDEEQLPLRLCALSPCFRAEAGAAGRDTRGLIRQHQFQKVEMVRFATPEQAHEELEQMVQRASDILTALELPHRIMLLCAGDMGFASEKTYDLEVWLPGANDGQGAYREISSCSTCGSFQARRAQIRSRGPDVGGKKAKPRPLCTLNGSGLAVGRTWIAVLENHQQADGSVRVPAALRPYLGGLEVLRPDQTTVRA